MEEFNPSLFIGIVINTALAFIIAEFAKKRRIGYTPALLLGILLSAVISFIAVCVSPVIGEGEEKKVTTSKADELLKWKKAFDAGAITESEYISKKQELL
jgi:uncharacterized membrane protein